MKNKSVLKKLGLVIFLQNMILFSLVSLGNPVKPTKVRSFSIEYDLGNEGIELFNKQSLYLEIPEDFINRKLIFDFASIAHRQDLRREQSENSWTNVSSPTYNDNSPGYTSLELHLQDSDEEGWIYWGGKGSGPRNSKFAEIRRNDRPEVDNLYEWQRHQWKRVSDGQSDNAPFSIDAARIVSLGSDPIRAHKVILKFLPPTPKYFSRHLFSNGMDFGDFASGLNRRFPGNHKCGDYGRGALLIEPHRKISKSLLPSEWESEESRLYIPLPKGSHFQSIDIATGDMKRNNCADAKHFRGGALISVDIVQKGSFKDTVIDELMSRENVGTNGVMRAVSTQMSYPSQEGDYLRITVSSDSASIMGIQVGFSQ